MIGINEEDSNDFQFMKEIIKKTRLEPDEKIAQIEKCLALFNDKTEKKTCPDIVEIKMKKIENLNSIKNDKYKTSEDKRKSYGIKIEKKYVPVKPYYIKQPTFNNGEMSNLSINDISKIITVGRECISSDEWICLYDKYSESDSFKLLKGFQKCAKSYGIKIKFKEDDSNWIPINSNKSENWIKTVESELKNRENCKFVIFLLNKNNKDLYASIK